MVHHCQHGQQDGQEAAGRLGLPGHHDQHGQLEGQDAADAAGAVATICVTVAPANNLRYLLV